MSTSEKPAGQGMNEKFRDRLYVITEKARNGFDASPGEVKLLLSAFSAAEAKCAELWAALSWAIGYINTDRMVNAIERGQSAIGDEMLDWLDRAEAAIANDDAGR